MNDLRNIRDRVYTLPTLQNKRQKLADELTGAAQQTQRLLKQCEKEQRDVENLQKGSFSNYVRRTVGRYESRAEKEWMEEAAAKAAYDKAAARQAQLEHTLAQLDKEIYDVQVLAGQYDAELQARRGALQTQPGSAAYQQLAALEASYYTMLAQATRIWQVSIMAQDIKSTADMAMVPLMDIQKWSSFYIGGAEWNSYRTYFYNRNNESTRLLNILSEKLWPLLDELRGIYWISASLREMFYSTDQFIAYWLTNPIERGTLEARIHVVWALQCYMINFTSALNIAYQQLLADLQANKMQQEELLSMWNNQI